MSVMFLLDRGFGVVMRYLQDHAKGGYIGHHNHILRQSNEEILIFGSSRAIHHYNPKIITDSLGMSCYNCGQDGNGIILFYGWWQVIKERHLPKMIIYDVSPGFDLLIGEDNSKFLGWLKSEYDNESVKQIFENIDPTEKYKMMSMMYRYNSKFLQNIIDYIHPIFQITPNGYFPLDGDMDKMKIKKDSNEEEVNYLFDAQKLYYLDNFIKETTERGVKLVFISSPVWYGVDIKQYEPLERMCRKYGVQFYNYSNDTLFVSKDEMFKDGSHLNAYGADEFSKLICGFLKYEKNERD